jgi:hypothetical protein
VFASATLAVVGRVVSFFLACFAGYAVAEFAAQFDGFFDFFRVWEWVGELPGQVFGLFLVPFEWAVSVFVRVIEKPWLALALPVYFCFAYKMFWTEADVLKLATALVVFEAVASFVSLGSLGWGILVLAGMLCGVVGVAWLFARWQYEREMRRLDTIERDNARKRAAKEAAERERRESPPARGAGNGSELRRESRGG